MARVCQSGVAAFSAIIVALSLVTTPPAPDTARSHVVVHAPVALAVSTTQVQSAVKQPNAAAAGGVEPIASFFGSLAVVGLLGVVGIGAMATMGAFFVALAVFAPVITVSDVLGLGLRQLIVKHLPATQATRKAQRPARITSAKPANAPRAPKAPTHERASKSAAGSVGHSGRGLQ